MDYQISRIIDVLKKNGIYDDTVIFFTSDHGDMMGDYGSMGKRTMLDSASNIPFMIKVPGKEHEVRHDPASLVDLAPTLLSLAGIDYNKGEYDGVNLFADKHELVYSQYSNGTAGEYMVTSGEDKLVYSAIGDRYFYFDSFPDAKDKYDEKNPRVRELKNLLDAYIASDRCPSVEKRDMKSPARQEKYSFYPPLDDHTATAKEEAARMPAGYPITLGGKKTDF